jgi:hypothetical protein
VFEGKNIIIGSMKFLCGRLSGTLRLSVSPCGTQLLSQKQDFRAEGHARAEQETEKKKPVRGQIGDQDKQRIQ